MEVKLSRQNLAHLPNNLPNTLRSLLAADNQLTTLPNDLFACRALTTLGLAANRLSDLPDRIALLIELQVLRLADNLIEELPEALGECASLRELTLARNRLVTLPSSLSRCPLVLLGAQANQIQRLPDGLLGGLERLKTLQLSDNRLTALPDDLSGCSSLQVLNLNGNRLRELPAALGMLRRLHTLGLGANRLERLPREMGGLKSLKTLQLGENRLTEVPASLCACARLEDLGLAQNRIAWLPAEVDQLGSLRSLVVAAGKFANLPASIGGLGSLVQLELSGSKLDVLPESICELACLRGLRVSDNRITVLPARIGRLRRLRSLRLDGNQLERLPDLGEPVDDDGYDVASLIELWCNANRLVELPHSLGSLLFLEELHASSNFIRELPRTLGRLRKLRRLLVDDNRLVSVPAELVGCDACVELGLAANELRALPDEVFRMPALHELRLNSNRLTAKPASLHLPEACDVWLHDNPFGDGCSAPRRPTVAVLLPGLVRSYSHGGHWRAVAKRYAAVYDLHFFVCAWRIRGAPSNNFSQEQDLRKAEPVCTEALAAAYPPKTTIELVDEAEYWVSETPEGHDGRFWNQWAMVQRCWRLMDRSGLSPEYVIRGRLDLRLSCIPRPLVRSGPYLAMQDYTWGSDAFFYGDAATMKSLCALADSYDEYTQRLGYACSEPMMEAFIKDRALGPILHFPRCFAIDREDFTDASAKCVDVSAALLARTWGALSDAEKALASRSYTLFHALCRLGLLECAAACATDASATLRATDASATLRVHILGADRFDCAFDATRSFEALDALLRRTTCARVQLLLCGPNLLELESLLSSTGAEGVHGGHSRVELTAASALYHDHCEANHLEPPHVAVAFNAGLWGYSSWEPTLRLLHERKVPLLLTCYNLEEAELDQDELSRVHGSEATFVWGAEANPWGSVLCRPQSNSSLPVAHENAAWMCLL